MTDEERQQCYNDWQKYKWKCDDFKEEVVKFFETFKPHENRPNRH